jgi:hypothetical protein
MFEINDQVLKERFRQNELYGMQRRPWGQWLAILGEEYGEACQAIQFVMGVETTKPSDSNNLLEELIHVAAVSCAMAEQILEVMDDEKTAAKENREARKTSPF